MIQKKLHIPGEMERASLEMDESWREVSWWRKNIQVESHVESFVNLNGTDGLEIMSEMTAKPMWKWNLESFAQEASC
jgi:hypothetical protein